MQNRTTLKECYEDCKITKAKVVVIGGGITGLSAVEHLQANGITDFILLESTNRFGGRMFSAPFGGSNCIVELGSNWIHGGNPANCVYTMACRHRLLPEKLVYLNRRMASYHFSDGRVLDHHTGVRLYDLFKQIEADTENLAENDRRTWDEYLKSRMEKEMADHPHERESVFRAVFNHFRNYVAVHGGDNLKSMTARGYGMFVEIPGGDIKLPAGFSTLSRNLVARLPASRLLINQKVDSIQWDLDPIQITCSNGQLFFADLVLVTIPLGVLKSSHRSMFEPLLPEQKILVIERMGFGRVGKIFLEYDPPFWQAGKLGILSLAWSDEEYSRGDWISSLLCFEEVLNNPKVLCSWIAGDNVPIIEELHEQEIGLACTKVLRTFLGDPSIPQPRNVLVSHWCNDVNVQGTYSFLTGQCNDSDFETLGLPVPIRNPKLLFAGEATNKYYYGTLHGARASGLREAERILNLINASAPL